MEPKALLTAMADIFEQTPDRWTHGVFARDVRNNAVETLAPNAHSFSLNGFLERSHAEGLVDEPAFVACYGLIGDVCFTRFGDRALVRLNDVEGREAVIAVLREAAK